MSLIAGLIIFIFLVLTCALSIIVFKSARLYKYSENTEQKSVYEPIIIHPTRKNGFKSRVVHALYYISVSSPETGASAPIALAQGKNVFGRSRSLSDFVIDDKRVSRIHFVIYVSKEQMIIEDCKSSNGTLLNGKKIGSTPRYLNTGDEICVGETKFIVSEI